MGTTQAKTFLVNVFVPMTVKEFPVGFVELIDNLASTYHEVSFFFFLIMSWTNTYMKNFIKKKLFT